MTAAAHLTHSATLLQDAVFRQRARRQRPLSSRVGCFDAWKRSCGPNASPDGCSTPTLGHSGAGVESFRPRVSGDNGCDGSPFIYHSGEGVRCLAVADDFTDGAKHAQCHLTTGDRLTLVYSKSVTAHRGECVVMMGGLVDSTMNRGCFFRVCLLHKGIFWCPVAFWLLSKITIVTLAQLLHILVVGLAALVHLTAVGLVPLLHLSVADLSQLVHLPTVSLAQMLQYIGRLLTQLLHSLEHFEYEHGSMVSSEGRPFM